jgi:hypothetical protein
MTSEPNSPDEFSLLDVDDESLSSKNTHHPDESSNSSKKSLTDKLRLAMSNVCNAPLSIPTDDSSSLVTTFKSSDSFHTNNIIWNSTITLGTVVSRIKIHSLVAVSIYIVITNSFFHRVIQIGLVCHLMDIYTCPKI